MLVPEISSSRPILYSFQDVVALRACVHLREEASLQKVRRALDTLRDDLDEQKHLSSYRLVADQDTIYLADADHAVDLVNRKGNLVIHEMVDVLEPFCREGRHIPALRAHLGVDPAIRGGEPTIEGTRIPAADVAALIRDGVAPDRIDEFYPGVTAAAALDAVDFADYVDSYADGSGRRDASCLRLLMLDENVARPAGVRRIEQQAGQRPDYHGMTRSYRHVRLVACCVLKVGPS